MNGILSCNFVRKCLRVSPTFFSERHKLVESFLVENIEFSGEMVALEKMTNQGNIQDLITDCNSYSLVNLAVPGEHSVREILQREVTPVWDRDEAFHSGQLNADLAKTQNREKQTKQNRCERRQR